MTPQTKETILDTARAAAMKSITTDIGGLRRSDSDEPVVMAIIATSLLAVESLSDKELSSVRRILKSRSEAGDHHVHDDVARWALGLPTMRQDWAYYDTLMSSLREWKASAFTFDAEAN